MKKNALLSDENWANLLFEAGTGTKMVWHGGIGATLYVDDGEPLPLVAEASGPVSVSAGPIWPICFSAISLSNEAGHLIEVDGLLHSRNMRPR